MRSTNDRLALIKNALEATLFALKAEVQSEGDPNCFSGYERTVALAYEAIQSLEELSSPRTCQLQEVVSACAPGLFWVGKDFYDELLAELEQQQRLFIGHNKSAGVLNYEGWGLMRRLDLPAHLMAWESPSFLARASTAIPGLNFASSPPSS